MTEFIIVTGVSGAGKSQAIAVLEDIGYYCIDNIPPALIKNFAELCENNPNLNRVAIVTDSRGGLFFDELIDVLSDLASSGINYKILFLEALVDVLVNRYKETRRRHPLSEGKSTRAAIEAEVKMLENLRGRADYIIDTTNISNAQLGQRIISLFSDNPGGVMNVVCMSFGFKYGPASEADLVFDIRCLPNPYFVEELREKTGLDTDVRDYVFGNDTAKTLIQKLKDLIGFLIPLYQKEGKSSLVIAIGCTGGKHRSVAFSEEIFKFLKEKAANVSINHRDMIKRAER